VPLADQAQDARRAYHYRAESRGYVVELFEKARNTAKARLEHLASGASLAFELSGAASGRTASGAVATAEVGGVAVRWTSYADRLKEDLVLSARPAGDRVIFTLEQRGLALTPDGQGSYVARDARGRKIFEIQAPTVHDATGRAGTATLSISGATATISLDSAFLTSATYPLTVDPTVVFGSGSSSATITYAYDKLSRLTDVSAPSGTTTYGYDPVGNRQSMTRGGSTTNYTYDRADRISAAGSVSYTVNANGNLINRGSDTFGYDQANRLKSVAIGASTATYAWDGDGKRASATVGGNTTPYIYDVNRGLPVVLDDGSRKYVWGLGLAYAVNGSAVEVYHADGLGSVRAITDGAGSVIQTYESDEFGVPTQTQGTITQPFQYTGEPRDAETGFVYLRARMYDPSIGRFMQRDTFAGAVGVPLSLNRFSYAHNNPATLIDPSGLATARALDDRGSTDNDCFSTAGGAFGGNLVNARCLLTHLQAIVPVFAPSPWGPVVVPAIVPMTPPRDPVGADGPPGEWHHIATNKATKSGYAQQFVEIFRRAGMTLQDDANLVYLPGHGQAEIAGAHSPAYREHVLRRLTSATQGLSGDTYGQALRAELQALKGDLLKNPAMVKGSGLP
jgi:RHS repeat-associated protein